MVRSWRACTEFAKARNWQLWRDISLVMSIHDENIYETKIGTAKELARAILPSLTEWPEFSVPIKVDFAFVPQGGSWAFKQNLSLEEDETA
jgi:DNA polymerase I-like protein with 3'-5' exonuclease and polymerase domains